MLLFLKERRTAMATVSLTRPMRFDKKESEALISFLESNETCRYKVKSSTSMKASKEMLKKLLETKNK